MALQGLEQLRRAALKARHAKLVAVGVALAEAVVVQLPAPAWRAAAPRVSTPPTRPGRRFWAPGFRPRHRPTGAPAAHAPHEGSEVGVLEHLGQQLALLRARRSASTSLRHDKSSPGTDATRSPEARATCRRPREAGADTPSATAVARGGKRRRAPRRSTTPLFRACSVRRAAAPARRRRKPTAGAAASQRWPRSAPRACDARRGAHHHIWLPHCEGHAIRRPGHDGVGRGVADERERFPQEGRNVHAQQRARAKRVDAERRRCCRGGPCHAGAARHGGLGATRWPCACRLGGKSSGCGSRPVQLLELLRLPSSSAWAWGSARWWWEVVARWASLSKFPVVGCLGQRSAQAGLICLSLLMPADGSMAARRRCAARPPPTAGCT